MLLHEWAERYITTNLALGKPGADQLRIAVRQLDRYVGRPVWLSDLTPELLAGWLRSLAETRAVSTVNSKRRSILTLWRSASETGLAGSLPMIRPAREPYHIPDSWTLEQVSQLLRYCKTLRGRVARIRRSDYYISLFLALFDSGERVGAVVKARVEDLDVACGTLLIRAESQKCRRDRLISLSPETVDVIQRTLTGLPSRRLLWPWPMSRRHFFRCLRRIIEDAGLPASKRGMGLTHRMRRTSGNLVHISGGCGWLHLGNSRAVWEKHYRDPRVCGGGQLQYLPRPRF